MRIQSSNSSTPPAKWIITVIILACIPFQSPAQIPAEIKAQFRKIIFLIDHDSVTQLSTMIEYPLKRENPLPDIGNQKEFVKYYPNLFDKPFMDMLNKYKDSEIFDHNGKYGLVGDIFHGEIWLSYDSKKISAINYSSEKELKLKEELKAKTQSAIHSSVNQWISNVMVCKGKGIIVRIDNTKDGLRYVSWTGGHKTSDKPDLILFKGKEEFLGTMGGWKCTFINGKWSYELINYTMGKASGPRLDVRLDGAIKSTINLEEIK